jgi:hypothetical protein
MESIKKPYKPKAEKVEKLTKVYAELKKAMPKANPLFKGVVKVLFMCILFASCSAEYHLNKAIQKNPSIITEKVIRRVDTLIIRDSVKIENTFVTKSVDTIIIDNEHFNTTIYRYHDTIKLLQILKGDTIRVTQKIVVPQVEVIKWYEKYLVSISVILGLIIFLAWLINKI